MQDPLANVFEIVLTNSTWMDPAIDMSDPDDVDSPSAQEALTKYRETRDMTVLRFKTDVKPTLFVCKRLPAGIVQSFLLTLAPNARALWAVLHGCHEIRMPDGSKLVPKKLERSGHGSQIVKDPHADEWLNTIRNRFGLAAIDEIGDVIYELSRLPEGAKGPFGYRVG